VDESVCCCFSPFFFSCFYQFAWNKCSNIQYCVYICFCSWWCFCDKATRFELDMLLESVYETSKHVELLEKIINYKIKTDVPICILDHFAGDCLINGKWEYRTYINFKLLRCFSLLMEVFLLVCFGSSKSQLHWRFIWW
jgi:hypothetical protein